MPMPNGLLGLIPKITSKLPGAGKVATPAAAGGAGLIKGAGIAGAGAAAGSMLSGSKEQKQTQESSALSNTGMIGSIAAGQADSSSSSVAAVGSTVTAKKVTVTDNTPTKQLWSTVFDLLSSIDAAIRTQLNFQKAIAVQDSRRQREGAIEGSRKETPGQILQKDNALGMGNGTSIIGSVMKSFLPLVAVLGSTFAKALEEKGVDVSSSADKFFNNLALGLTSGIFANDAMKSLAQPTNKPSVLSPEGKLNKLEPSQLKQLEKAGYTPRGNGFVNSAGKFVSNTEIANVLSVNRSAVLEAAKKMSPAITKIAGLSVAFEALTYVLTGKKTSTGNLIESGTGLIGGILGALGGGAVGSLLGPVGTFGGGAAGGIAGDAIGRTAGNRVNRFFGIQSDTNIPFRQGTSPTLRNEQTNRSTVQSGFGMMMGGVQNVMDEAFSVSSGGFNMSNYLTMTRSAESGGKDNAKARTSSASGRYQFIEGTFKEYYQKVYGGSKKDADNAWRNRRFDPEIQEALMRRFTQDNVNFLKKMGVNLTNGNVYLTHFLGQGGAGALLRASPNTPVEALLDRKIVNANPTILRNKTAGQVIAWADKKMSGKGTLPKNNMKREEVQQASAPVSKSTPVSPQIKKDTDLNRSGGGSLNLFRAEDLRPKSKDLSMMTTPAKPQPVVVVQNQKAQPMMDTKSTGDDRNTNFVPNPSSPKSVTDYLLYFNAGVAA